MAHRMINSDDQCENKAKMDVQAAPQEQMESGWSVWTLDGRCGHPSANQNVASSVKKIDAVPIILSCHPSATTLLGYVK